MLSREEKALLSLLSDDDPDIRRKVAKEVAQKGLYGIQMLNRFGFSIAQLAADHPAADLIFTIIRNEIILLLRQPDSDIMRFVYLLGFLDSDYYPFSEVASFINTAHSKIRNLAEDDISAFRRFDALNMWFFEKSRFRAEVDYPASVQALLFKNIFSHHLGSGLSLGIIYLAIARRLDLPIDGLYIGNYFFARFSHGTFAGIVDIANQGRILSFNEAHWFMAASGHSINFETLEATDMPGLRRAFIAAFTHAMLLKYNDGREVRLNVLAKDMVKDV
jgi:hypothetical protein